MSSWRALPDRSWSAIGQSLSGFGRGAGQYGLSYALDADRPPFLNGRVSARVRLGNIRRAAGAGVVCRADDLRTLVAFYVSTDVDTPDHFSVRLAAFKYGTIVAMATQRKPITIPDGEAHLSLQFFSGDLVGELVTRESSVRMSHLIAEVPFAGRAGLIRFYDSPVFARDIQIEEISSRPMLPEEVDRKPDHGYRYDVFISHSSADKEKVRPVVERFRQEGISYWIDEEKVTFGDPIVARIEEGLQQSRYVVVALSGNLKSSGWVRAEYGPILHREFSGDTTRRVIPLSLDGALDPSGIPLLLSDKLRANFTDPGSFDAFLRFLKKRPSEVP
jgi:hypothetical protein